MSQYPPPPPFRGPLQSNTSLVSPLGNLHHVMPQFPYHPFRDQNNQSMPSTPYSNQYSYNAASQNINGSVSVTGALHAPYIGFGQAINGSFPPPPQGAFPRPPSLAHHHESSFGSMQPHNSLPLKPPPVTAMMGNPSSENSQTVTTAISELEDGELSDGEHKKYPILSVSNTAKTSQNPSKSDMGDSLNDGKINVEKRGGASDIVEADREVDNNRKTHLSHSPEKFNLQHSPNLQSAQEQSLNQVKNNLIRDYSGQRFGNNNGLKFRSQDMLSKSFSSSESVARPTSTHQGDLDVSNVASSPLPRFTTSQKKRTEAKEALAEMYSWGIGYAQIVAEGISASILQDLYGELGISVPSPSPVNQVSKRIKENATDNTISSIEQSRLAGNIPRDNDLSNVIDSLNNSWQVGQPPDMPKLSPGSSSKFESLRDQTLTFKHTTGESENNIVERNATNIEFDIFKPPNSNPVSKPVQPTRLSKPSSGNLVNKPTTLKPGDKALERKEYIARMLAAKASKPISITNPTPLSKATSNPLMETTTQTPSVGSNEPISSSDARRLFIGNLSTKATEGDLKNLFSTYSIKKVSIPINPHTGKSFGYGFVELSTTSEAQRAITELSGEKILGSKISIEVGGKSKNTTISVEVSTSLENQCSAENVPYNTPPIDRDAEANKKAQTELARQKIEALKNSGRIPQFSQQINPDYMAASQDTEILDGVPNLRTPREPCSATPPSPSISHSNPQSSFFTSASRKPLVAIPGLFMGSTAPEHSAIGDQATAHTPPVKSHANSQLAQGAEPQVFEPESLVTSLERTPTLQSPLMTVEAIPTLFAKPIYGTQATTSTIVAKGSRKRQKAADFIDSPSVRVRRPLGQDGDTSVVIEVSEDESSGHTEEEPIDAEEDIAMDIDDDHGQNTLSKEMPSSETGIEKHKAIRDLLPLSNFPARKKASSNIARMTSPATLTPNKSREPEDLKIKEKAIELMNRKIAELEQRIKAKQTASRAQTPGTPGIPKASTMLPGTSAKGSQKPRSTVSDTESNEITNSYAEVQNSEEVDKTADIEEKSKTDQLTEAIGISEAAEIAKAAEAAKAVENERLLAEKHLKARELAKAEDERVRAQKAAEAQLEEQRRLRRIEIEAGLPILDAEVERTKRNLQALRNRMEELESEVQKGVEGRQILLEELMELSPDSKPSTINQEQMYRNGNAHQVPMQTDKTPGLFPPENTVDLAEAQQSLKVGLIVNQKSQCQSLKPFHMEYSPQSTKDQIALDEQKMSIDTLIDEFNNDKVADSSPKSQMDFPADLEKDYEPPTIRNDIPALAVVASVQQHTHELQNANTTDLQSTLDTTCTNADKHGKLLESEAASISSHPVRALDEQQASIRSLQPADSSDSDDYEPPEPGFPVENKVLSFINSPANLKSQATSSVADKSAIVQPILADSISIIKNPTSTENVAPFNADIHIDQATTQGFDMAKFKPYESPLRHFKSYRYHPAYLSEIPRGFRSLTYSHGINPGKPLCRFETAGGVCNDDSCDGQHFRDMGLSDDMVLVQMGAIPEGLTSEEGDAYANGLRRIIQEIRGRKVRDFNAVATEITAYRAKFLGDKPKVLPL